MNTAVLIPVFRNQAGLNRSLESLAEADGTFEVVIVDDGSMQPIGAPPRLRGDVPVTLIRLPRNAGISAALNYGLRHILARQIPYVARLDAGDIVMRERFRLQSAFLDSNPECAIVSSFVDFLAADRKHLFRFRAPTDHVGIMRRMRINNCMIHPASTIRVAALREVGLYREDMIRTEDYELFMRIAERHSLAVIPQVLTLCEYSKSGLSVTGRSKQQRQRLKLQVRYFDAISFHSIYGIARTLLSMLIPSGMALRMKRTYSRS